MENGSTTGDHVFAREFLPVEHRANLPQVPACERCNAGKAKLEHYLLTLMPFGGDHPASTDLLIANVPRRLAKNVKLRRQLAEGRGPVLVKERGILLHSMALPFEGRKLSELFALITRGMVSHAFRVQIPQGYSVNAGILTERGEEITRPLLAMNAKDRAVATLADGLIEYEGAQAFDNPALTVWRYRLYGGVLFADPNSRGHATKNIWAISAPAPLPGLFAE
ncbi:hypothetical protein [Sphingobium aromaticivastans]|uniref:hypothetical protein n=1 Tax=Sphingobium aromaticivastans TaxID=1778665 RepID=UPI00301B475D